MDLLVVDTDVVSFYFKNDPRAQPYMARWAGKTLVVSFMRLAELQLWALVRKWGSDRTERLRSFLVQHFVVHPVDERLCGLWAAVMAESQSKAEAPNRRCLDRGDGFGGRRAAGDPQRQGFWSHRGVATVRRVCMSA